MAEHGQKLVLALVLLLQLGHQAVALTCCQMLALFCCCLDELEFFTLGNVGKQPGHPQAASAAQLVGRHVPPAFVWQLIALLNGPGLASQCDLAVKINPVLLNGGHQLPDGFANRALQAAQALKGRVDIQEAVVSKVAFVINDHLDDEGPFAHGVKQQAGALLNVTCLYLRPLQLGNVLNRAVKDFKILALRAGQQMPTPGRKNPV